MIENRKNYRLDVDKIKTLQDVKNVFDSIRFIGYYDADDPEDENYYLSEYFTIPQEPQELTIPAPRKSIEELQQDFDGKMDELLVKTKRKFAVSKQTAEYHYNAKFAGIIQDFEYAKKHGEFRPKLTLTYGTGLSAGSYETSFVIKQGNKHEGYYTFGNGRYIKYYMPTKPNVIARFFMKTCLALRWVDEK
jgi:hypothetical protein